MASASSNPQAVAAKWVQRMQQSTAQIQAGVQATTVNPAQQAAAASSYWQQQVSSPAAKNKYVNSLNKVSLSDWQNAMLNKGVNRVGSGAAAAQSKFQSFMAAWLPHVLNVAAQVRAMPKGGLENGINRMVAQVRGNAAFSGQ